MMQQERMFEAVVVDCAVIALQKFSEQKQIGKPSGIVICSEPPGIGAMWSGGIRKAFCLKGINARNNQTEIKRRLDEWTNNREG